MIRSNLLVDSHGRILRDLRVSVTDRCNFRCLYCLPETEAAANFYRGRWSRSEFQTTPISRQWQRKENILTFEEIERAVRLAAELGIQKVRLTGGEPLLRQDLHNLIERLAGIDGIEDLALTTNGFHFPQKATALRDAGLRRISFSLDSLDPENFQKITGRDALPEVLKGIRLARELGLNPVKVNAVIIRGINDHEIDALARFAREEDVSMRFIEFMPLDSGRAWFKELVISGKEILERIEQRHPLEPVASSNRAETAKRWRFVDGPGEIGVIAPVTEPFCGHCNRLRLMADGKLRTCLFSTTEHDLRELLRSEADDTAVRDFLQSVVWQKELKHRIGEKEFVAPTRSMSCIGG